LHEAVTFDRRQSLPQSTDVNVDGSLLHTHRSWPKASKQIRARENAIGIAHEKREQASFGWSQFHTGSVLRGLTTPNIKLHGAVQQWRGCQSQLVSHQRLDMVDETL
jgi:hypothetical protein